MIDLARDAANDTATGAIHSPGMSWRRRGLLLVVIVTVLVGLDFMLEILNANGMTPLEAAILVLFTITFAWICIAFWTALAGFFVQALRRDPLSLRRVPRRPPRDLSIVTRTALLMPVYNEDVQRVSAGLEAILHDVHATGDGEAFDAYLLSDTTDADTAAAEEAAVVALRRRLPGGHRLYYRRRSDNEGRKAGNIAEFCRRWGGYYDFMVVLDADSIMTGATLTGLVRTMQATPAAGMLQTVPIPVRQETLFGRFLQFAATLYSPMLAAGMSFWQGDVANYWGHNAIIRVQAFMDHCGLPKLPGHPPLGGNILSHDFVEAALMRRAGWHVYLLPEVGGSYEQLPGNILDYATRDRRWSEGNLQHLRLLMARGLHPLSRLYFVMGALAYGCSLLWLLMLTVSTLDAGSRALTVASYFGATHQLFPDWPVARTEIMLWLLGTVIVMLILPKICGTLLCLFDSERRQAFGGGLRLTVSALLELVFSVLIAPIMMTFHAFFVVSVLLGRRATWHPQNRDSHEVGWRAAVRYTGVLTVAGVLWGIGTAFITPIFFWALTPVLTGLVLAPAVVVLSSRVAWGRALRRCGLLLTPAETRPPYVLDWLERRVAERDVWEMPADEILPLPDPCPRPMPAQRLDRPARRIRGKHTAT